jgi:hypothetical protein
VKNGGAETHYLEVTPLRGEIKERWRELCERAVVERDPEKFLTTIQELLQVLEDGENSGAVRQGYECDPERNLPG